MTTSEEKEKKPMEIPNISSPSKSESSVDSEIPDPSLRKKICLKLSKILRKNLFQDLLQSQENAIKIEEKVRNDDPKMGTDYKEKLYVIFKSLKVKIYLLIKGIGWNRRNFERKKD